jgi:hypothetical protein
VKQAGLALPDPTKSAPSNYEASTCANSHLIAALKGNEDFSALTHVITTKEVRSELAGRKTVSDGLILAAILSTVPPLLKRALTRAKENGRWLSVTPSTVNGTELSAQEWRDAAHLRHGRAPGDLPSHCDGCGQKFSIPHALECKIGGNVICRHNALTATILRIASQALIPSAVRNEPLIHTSCPAVTMSVLEQANSPVTRNLHKNLDRGDGLIRGLWEPSTDCIIDVRFTDTDASSYLSKDPAKVLEQHEKEKKKKYLKPCLEQRRHFTPFVVSTDGL